MERVCKGCGKKFDTSEVSEEQREFYGYNVCKECWHISNEQRSAIDYLSVDDSMSKEVSFSGRWQNYCICHIDMVDSTKIMACMPDAELSEYYTIFLNSMGKIARNFHATTLKNIGDSLLCYFPQTSDSTSRSAFQDVLECCVAMVDAHGIINKKLYTEGLPPLGYRISADYGRVEIVRSRTSHTDDLFGSTMNLCAKINYMASPNGMVIGGDLHRILKSFMFDGDYHLEEVGAYSMGLQHRYPVYSVVSKRNNTVNPFQRAPKAEPAEHLQTSVGSQAGQWKKYSYNIMLIDDEVDILFVFKSILGSEGYNVEVFADSQQALDHMTKMGPSYYDLVITDIRMPGINGLQLYETVKAISKDMKIIFVSALDVAEELLGYLPGVKRSDVIRKPVSQEKLVSVVRAALP